MGQRGPAEGTKDKYGVQVGNAEALTEIPDAPSKLDHRARKEWDTVAGVLVSRGLLDVGNLTHLAEYCRTVSYLECVQKELAEQGVTYQSGNTTKKNPLVDMERTYADRMMSLANQFGLTPASRPRVKEQPAGEADPLEKFQSE